MLSKLATLIFVLAVTLSLSCGYSPPATEECEDYIYKVICQMGNLTWETKEVSEKEFWKNDITYSSKFRNEKNCTIYAFQEKTINYYLIIPSSPSKYSYFQVSPDVFWVVYETMDTYNLRYKDSKYSVILDIDILSYPNEEY